MRSLHAGLALEPLLKIFYTFDSKNFPRKIADEYIENLDWRNSRTVRGPQNVIVKSFSV